MWFAMVHKKTKLGTTLSKNPDRQDSFRRADSSQQQHVFYKKGLMRGYKMHDYPPRHLGPWRKFYMTVTTTDNGTDIKSMFCLFSADI